MGKPEKKLAVDRRKAVDTVEHTERACAVRAALQSTRSRVQLTLTDEESFVIAEMLSHRPNSRLPNPRTLTALVLALRAGIRHQILTQQQWRKFYSTALDRLLPRLKSAVDGNPTWELRITDQTVPSKFGGKPNKYRGVQVLQKND